MTSAISAFGTFLQRGDGGSPETFTTIAEVLDISGPELTLDTVDVTSHDSPGGWEEHMGTILRSGEVTFQVNFIPSNVTHTDLKNDMTSRTLSNWKLVFPDATEWAFSGIVTRFAPSAPVADRLTAEIAIKVSGQPTLA